MRRGVNWLVLLVDICAAMRMNPRVLAERNRLSTFSGCSIRYTTSDLGIPGSYPAIDDLRRQVNEGYIDELPSWLSYRTNPHWCQGTGASTLVKAISSTRRELPDSMICVAQTLFTSYAMIQKLAKAGCDLMYIQPELTLSLQGTIRQVRTSGSTRRWCDLESGNSCV